MSILPFCDHRVLVHRENPDQDEYGDTVRNWTAVAVPDGLNATLNRNWSGNMADQGPGDIQSTTRQWFLLPGFTVRERDVLQVVTAPTGSQEAGRLYRVESVSAATMPIEVHHWEVIASVARPTLLQTEAEVGS